MQQLKQYHYITFESFSSYPYRAQDKVPLGLHTVFLIHTIGNVHWIALYLVAFEAIAIPKYCTVQWERTYEVCTNVPSSWYPLVCQGREGGGTGSTGFKVQVNTYIVPNPASLCGTERRSLVMSVRMIGMRRSAQYAVWGLESRTIHVTKQAEAVDRPT
jgi:hypothetical protein